MLNAKQTEDAAMGAFIRELHKEGVSFQAINRALAGASVELATNAEYAPALSFIKNGIELIGIVADAHSDSKRSQ